MHNTLQKTFALLLALLVGMIAFTGCQSQQSSTAAPEAAAIIEQIADVVSIPNAAEITDADTISTMYDLDFDTITDLAMLKSATGANADEIIVIRLGENGDAAAVSDAFETRLSVLTDLFSDYTPEDMPKIEQAQTASNGDYYILAVCSDPDAAIDAFQAAFRD
jgi:hypothetical protein